ncbi:NAD(P)/FAD-dependent oxidoreductase [Fictibacillus enclensis]|uniref:NAD(P)/FAD-dependent oxidoreductase n=1 Tax=Fictibacillus enclensis TaxID=1017270 RepID=UPI0025A00AEF|nr:NAD(P)/FAD-dependent oxidoreductase [Fictibacillus enclensis]MDM5335686.1 NAD(P)/FAD-dependent oxidoreductase [Fictibacillus enclensis]
MITNVEEIVYPLPTTYDVIIVGARAAGASLALFLGRKGYKVLVLDKFDSPGPKACTHVIGEVDLYERMGIKDKMESLGSPNLTRMRVEFEGHAMESDIMVTSRAISLRRELFDSILLNEVRRLPNVVLLRQHQVTNTIKQNGTVIGLECKTKEGEILSFKSKIVVGADGTSSLIARDCKAASQTSISHQHSILFGYVKHLKPYPLPTMEWLWNDRDILLCNPIDNQMHCIALIFPEEEFPQPYEDLTSFFFSRIQNAKNLGTRLKTLDLLYPVKGVRKMTSFIKQSFGEGWALVGDASATLHPISGIGIDNAIICSEFLALELDQFFSGKKSFRLAMENYQCKRDERLYPQYEAMVQTLNLARSTPSDEAINTMQMLCTFPSLVKKIGMSSNNVYNLITK